MNQKATNKPSATSQEMSATKHGLAEQAKETVSHVAEQAKGEVIERADTTKDTAVEAMTNVASAIRNTTKKHKQGGPVVALADRAADGIERASKFFEGKSASQLVDDVERFSRREPAIFLATVFATGLIGGRFLKSSARRTRQGDRSRRESVDNVGAPYAAIEQRSDARGTP